jgi:hypothetical protein
MRHSTALFLLRFSIPLLLSEPARCSFAHLRQCAAMVHFFHRCAIPLAGAPTRPPTEKERGEKERSMPLYGHVTREKRPSMRIQRRVTQRRKHARATAKESPPSRLSSSYRLSLNSAVINERGKRERERERERNRNSNRFFRPSNNSVSKSEWHLRAAQSEHARKRRDGGEGGGGIFAGIDFARDVIVSTMPRARTRVP